MRMQIVDITDRGKAYNERLHMIALADMNLAQIVVFDSERVPGKGVRRAPKRAYWFPAEHVKAGDHIILYSKNGRDTSTDRTDGKKNWFFHWEVDTTLWGAPNACVVVLDVSDWTTFPMP